MRDPRGFPRYPEPDAGSLGHRLARLYRLDGDYILPTAGAIEGLYLAAKLFERGRVAIVEPAFSDYGRSFATVDCELEHVILPRELWHASVSRWAHLLEPFDVVVFGNPNNPTGSMQSRSELRRLLETDWSPPKQWIVHGVRIKPRGRNAAFNCLGISLIDRAAVAHEELAGSGVNVYARVPLKAPA